MILFGSKRKMWTSSVYLTDSLGYLPGVFNFDAHSYIIITKLYIALAHLEYLLTICNILSIVPLILSILTDVKGLNKKWKKRA